MNETKRDQVFISYAHENLEDVKNVVQGLKKRKLKLWFDKEHLAPGRWKTQIIKAITRSRYFIICLSKGALRKTGEEPGFQDNELNTAYEIAQAQADQEFTIVPVRLEDCERGDFRLTSFQQYDLFPDIEEGLDKLAVHLGGVPLIDDTVQDKRTENEKTLENLLGRANSAFYAVDFEKALGYFALAREIDKNNIESLVGLSLTLDKLDRLEEALPFLDLALLLDPSNYRAYCFKGRILMDLNRYEQALTALDISLKSNPDYAKAWENKGFALDMLGRSEKALQAYDKALEIDPDNFSTWRSKGILLFKLQRFEQVLPVVNKALELNANDVTNLLTKGAALHALGRPEEALPVLDKALELNPDDANVLRLKVVVLHELGR